jgi:hypothetical protein
VCGNFKLTRGYENNRPGYDLALALVFSCCRSLAGRLLFSCPPVAEIVNPAVEFASLLTMVLSVAIVTALATLVALVLCALRPAVRGLNATHTDLDREGMKRELDVLLRRGYDGGYLIFTDVDTSRFIQFRKYVHAKGQLGLETHFPRVGWSQEFYSRVQDVLRRMQMAHDRRVLEQGVEMICADFGTDLDAAADFADSAFTEIFELSTPRIAATGDGMSPFDETINTPERPSAWSTTRRVLSSRFRD